MAQPYIKPFVILVESVGSVQLAFHRLRVLQFEARDGPYDSGPQQRAERHLTKTGWCRRPAD